MPGLGEAVEFAVLVGSLGAQFAFVIPFLVGAVAFAVLVRRHGLSFSIAMPHSLVAVRLAVLVGGEGLFLAVIKPNGLCAVQFALVVMAFDPALFIGVLAGDHAGEGLGLVDLVPDAVAILQGGF